MGSPAVVVLDRGPEQHPELMAENEDLEVLGSVDSTSPSSPDEETDEGADDEVVEGQHRPIVPGLSERESRFPPPRAGVSSELATLTRNRVVPAGPADDAAFDVLAEPTPLQARAFDLIGVSPTAL